MVASGVFWCGVGSHLSALLLLLLLQVCVAAEQGLASLLKNLQLALGEPSTFSTTTTLSGTTALGSTTSRPQGPPSASAASDATRRSQPGAASAAAVRDVRSPGSTGSAGRGAKAVGREQQLAESTASKNARWVGCAGAAGQGSLPAVIVTDIVAMGCHLSMTAAMTCQRSCMGAVCGFYNNIPAHQGETCSEVPATRTAITQTLHEHSCCWVMT